MDKYTIYIICKNIDIFNNKKLLLEKNNNICSFHWLPSQYLKLCENNLTLINKLDTRYNTKEKNILAKLGCIAAHRNALLSIINNDSINNIILEEDAELTNILPNPPEKSCYLGGWIIPPQISKAGKINIHISNLKKNDLNEINYDNYKILTTHSLFIKSPDEAKHLLLSTIQPTKIKNYDVFLANEKYLKYFYYPEIFNQSKHKSEISNENKNHNRTINYGLLNHL